MESGRSDPPKGPPSKLPKQMQIVGFVLLALGVVVRVDGHLAGTAIALLGFALWCYGRVMEWYRRD